MAADLSALAAVINLLKVVIAHAFNCSLNALAAAGAAVFNGNASQDLRLKPKQNPLDQLIDSAYGENLCDCSHSCDV